CSKQEHGPARRTLRTMRHRPLHAALSAFADECAWQLTEETADGAEVPFEIVESRGARRDTPLYCYRPLTGPFIRDRVGVLERLPSYPAAARALAALDGVGDYLRAQAEPRVPADPRERADLALCVFVSRVFCEATEFVITPERFDRAYRELDDALLDGRAEAVVLAPLFGLRLVSAEVPLGQGLSLIRGEELPDAPAEAVWPGGVDEPCVLACLALTDDAGAPAPLSEACVRFRRLLTALRLYDPVRVAFGPVAWERTGAGPWSIGDIGMGGRANGVITIAEEAEDELRAFCSLIARRTPRAGELAWALRRYELGCERASAFEALTDHLLGLRALLEPEGPQSGRLAGRVAALCATPEQRLALTERVAHAVSMERAIVAGLAPMDGGVEKLLAEVTSHLRALLRDVLCGHLDSDLRALADQLLAESGATA
ncbi:MAG: hypothetical protein KY433_07700, partial [Actinobacteria bacterium]|nr:hypothetical protein [Actinomycetota bacterium]